MGDAISETTGGYQYPTPPVLLQGRSSFKLFRYFGAGAILASVTIGSGETLFASRGGAVFGYSLFWCFIVGAIAKAIQVYTAARHITLTGHHPMEHWGELPGPRNWVPLTIGVMSLLCFPFFLGALPLVLGELINEIFAVAEPGDAAFGMWARIWATAASLLAIFLTWKQRYGVLERAQVVIVGILLLSLLVACLAARPDWALAIRGSLIPIIPSYENWVLQEYGDDFRGRTPWVEIIVYLGALGGGTYDYIGYVACLREKAWGAIGQSIPTNGHGQRLAIDTSPENVLRAKQWLVAPRIDVGVSFACVLVFSCCFVLLGASILHPQHIIPAKEGELLTHQATFLTAINPKLVYLYQLGVFMAFWGTIYGAYEIYLRTAYECLAPLSRRIRSISKEHFRRSILLYCGCGGLILLWSTNDPIGLVTFPALLGGVLTCGLWCFAMLWVDSRTLPRSLQMGWRLRIGTFFSGLLLTGLGMRALWDFAGSF